MPLLNLEPQEIHRKKATFFTVYCHFFYGIATFFTVLLPLFLRLNLLSNKVKATINTA